MTALAKFRRCPRKLARLLALGLMVSGASAVVQPAVAQNLKKVRYSEVIRTIMYLPTYVALSNGYFKDQGLDVDMSTAWGSDKARAQLLTGRVDIALLGPESAIYIANGASSVKVKMIGAVTATDGLFLMSRKKMAMDAFTWDMLKGKEVIGWTPGTTPAMFFEFVMKEKGIDPARDTRFVTNIARQARFGAWLAGRGDFIVFFEPDVSHMEQLGKASPVASIGKEIGKVDYTVFLATDPFIKENPEILEAWLVAIYRAQKWIAQSDPKQAARLASAYFPKVPVPHLESAVERYRAFGIWKTDPETRPAAVEKLQDILIFGGVLKSDDRVAYTSVVDPSFARKAKAMVDK